VQPVKQTDCRLVIVLTRKSIAFNCAMAEGFARLTESSRKRSISDVSSSQNEDEDDSRLTSPVGERRNTYNMKYSKGGASSPARRSRSASRSRSTSSRRASGERWPPAAPEVAGVGDIYSNHSSRDSSVARSEGRSRTRRRSPSPSAGPRLGSTGSASKARRQASPRYPSLTESDRERFFDKLSIHTDSHSTGASIMTALSEDERIDLAELRKWTLGPLMEQVMTMCMTNNPEGAQSRPKIRDLIHTARAAQRQMEKIAQRKAAQQAHDTYKAVVMGASQNMNEMVKPPTNWGTFPMLTPGSNASNLAKSGWFDDPRRRFTGAADAKISIIELLHS